MKKYRVIWTPQAQQDLKSIKAYISQHDPRAAASFVKRIRQRGRKLVTLPSAGVPVEQPFRPDLREFFVGNYRIIYHVGRDVVHILLAAHGARLLGSDELPTIE